MKKNNYYRFIPLLLGLIIFVYFYVYRVVVRNSDYFYKNSIQAKIIRIKNYESKSLQFYYDHDYCITTTDTKGDLLSIGDSIYKEINTDEFKVFRKIGNKYILFKTYNGK
nr:hypothetical protein [uncultured Chryseobacterium sp.]